MKIKEYDEIDINLSNEDKNKIEGVAKRTLEKYSDSDRDGVISGNIKYSLIKMNSVLNGDFTGKYILDLGCGSRSGHLDGLPTSSANSRYEPWLCRALSNTGANPIGLDIGKNYDEEFTHYPVDLTNKDSLGFLEDNSIDLANAKMLFTSMLLQENSTDFKNNLISQLERVVKPEGVFIYDN